MNIEQSQQWLDDLAALLRQRQDAEHRTAELSKVIGQKQVRFHSIADYAAYLERLAAVRVQFNIAERKRLDLEDSIAATLEDCPEGYPLDVWIGAGEDYVRVRTGYGALAADIEYRQRIDDLEWRDEICGSK